MAPARIGVVIAFVLVLALPFLVRAPGQEHAGAPAPPDRTLIIVTPHIEQIRAEFEQAFVRWHAFKFPHEGPVAIDWRSPGTGTSEIVMQLKSQYEAAVKAAAAADTAAAGAPADPQLTVPAPLAGADEKTPVEVRLAPRSMSADLLFGGGSYEHGQLKAGVTIKIAYRGPTINALVRISEPAGLPQPRMNAWFGQNVIGAQNLYDPDQFWIGTALSSFGIVYNRLVLKDLGLPEPASFEDLTDPRYSGLLALTDPRQSGSVTTTFESILNGAPGDDNQHAWDKGWRLLRQMGANARYFASSSTRPPIDVSQGEAAAGLAIDFYGRGEAQAVLRPGESPRSGRVGYVDPKGAVYIDADPASILAGCPHPELARRFVEFCLTDEAQALWQMPAAANPASADNPIGQDGRRMGPAQYELRRMPVRRAMYEPRYRDHFIDKANPFELASPTKSRGWRSAIGMMLGAMTIDTADEQREAWAAMNRAKHDSSTRPEALAEMERLFYAFPTGQEVRARFGARFPDAVLPADAALDFSPAVTDADDAARNPRHLDNCKRIANSWSDPVTRARLKIVYTEFFRENYQRIVRFGASTN